jgi:acetyltransferase-like isoleucine patch superfamily enzyme
MDSYQNKVYRTKFGRFGKGSVIKKPILLTNPDRIFIGKRVFIRDHARIELVNSYRGKSFSPYLYIDDDVSVEQNLHLTCGENIHIERNVAVAANVTITDIKHTYNDPIAPIKEQNIITVPVKIGEGSVILNGAVVTPGTVLGKNCAVASNSVVIGQFPDFSFIGGVPAKIIKKFGP